MSQIISDDDLVRILEDSDGEDEVIERLHNMQINGPEETIDDIYDFINDSEVVQENITTSDTWNLHVRPLERNYFTGFVLGKRQNDLFDANTDLCTVFFQIITDDIIDFMVTETNTYASQTLQQDNHRIFARIKRWTLVTRTEMCSFLGILLLTGLIPFPTIESYWKKKKIYYHPLFHEIKMSYNRFVLIFKCWHFVDNMNHDGGRLFKIQPLIDKIISNFKKIYTPGPVVVVDESVVKFRGRLSFRTYNPQKSVKYGMRIYKMCTDKGYTWDYKVYAAENKVINPLDKTGSLVIQLGQDILNEGRLIVTDNYYTSVPLAKYLKERNTDLCGTIRSNRRNLPKEVVKAKLKVGEVAVLQNSNMTVLKWHDKRDVLMLSTCHGKEMEISKAFRPILKPKMILDYNKTKLGIDLSDQLSSYNSPVRKTSRWYKKIATDLLSIAVVNSIIIFKEISNTNNIMTVTKGQEIIVEKLLNVRDPSPSRARPLLNMTHKLTIIPRKLDGKIVQRRCTGCYKKIAEQKTANMARKGAKQVQTECIACNKVFCLPCYNEAHY
jgi:hypothetical protein